VKLWAGGQGGPVKPLRASLFYEHRNSTHIVTYWVSVLPNV
jgi:hypothetical protein